MKKAGDGFFLTMKEAQDTLPCSLQITVKMSKRKAEDTSATPAAKKAPAAGLQGLTFAITGRHLPLALIPAQIK